MQGPSRPSQSRRPHGQHPLGRVVRYRDSEPSARKADANDSKSRFHHRHGQNVWGIAIGLIEFSAQFVDRAMSGCLRNCVSSTQRFSV
jgi:hypothetical protein